MKSLPGPEVRSSPSKAGGLTDPAQLVAEMSSPPHLARKQMENTWELPSPASLRHGVRQAHTIFRRAKPEAPFGQETWGVGQLESRPQRALLSVESSLASCRQVG